MIKSHLFLSFCHRNWISDIHVQLKSFLLDMFNRQLPPHLQRTVDLFRVNPMIFFRRSPADKAFFLEQVSCWIDQQFVPPHPGLIRVNALSLSTEERLALETLILRFVRKLIFPYYPEVVPPDSWEWFTYRFLKNH